MSSAPLSIKELKNSLGQTIWFVPTDIPVVSVGISFRHAGDKSSPHDKPGIVDLLAALLDEGCGPYDSQSFKKRLLEKNISLTIASNQDNFVITFRTVKENLQEAFQLIKLILTEPRFEEDDLHRLQTQMVAGLQQSLHHPQPVGKEALQNLILGENHPYTKRTHERIQKIPHISSAELRDHMRQIFTQSNLQMAVAGGVKEEEILNYTAEAFQELPKGDLKADIQAEPLKNLGQTIHIPMDIPQTFIYLAHPGIKRDSPDFYALFLINRILGSGNTESRLWEEIREKRGLAYFFNTDLFINDLAYGLIGITATKTESVEETIALIKSEWQKLIDFGITPEEFEFHKKYIMSSYPLSFGSTIDIVNVLLRYMQDGLPSNYVNERNGYFEKLTLEYVNEVIKRTLDPNQLTFIVIGRQSNTAKT